MLDTSPGYRSAIVGDVRSIVVKAVLQIIDPDITFADDPASGAPYSKPAQLHDGDSKANSRYITAEQGRWVLDGTFRAIPDNPQELGGEIGWVSDVMSNADGWYDSSAQWPTVSIRFSGVEVLQAFSVIFSDDPDDGIPSYAEIKVLSGSSVVYRHRITDFQGNRIDVSGFTVNSPTEIRLTIRRWSKPFRRARVIEIIPGLREEWTADNIVGLDVQMRGNPSCLSIPYGTCTLTLDNTDKRFEARNRDGFFRSIEERQGIPIYMGAVLPDRSTEYQRLGTFYQFSGGWRTSENDSAIKWELVDIIGLVSGREYNAPEVLPTTLSGWLASIVAQLGKNFKNLWKADPAFADLPAVVKNRDDVQGRRCGDLLRFVCMATGTWPRADAQTGKLTAEPLWNQGGRMDLDNLSKYPVIEANDDVGGLTFNIYDKTDDPKSKNTQYLVSGTASASSQTLSIDNPFIHTREQALTAAKLILSQYGGTKISTVGRGDPASEIGDVDTVWLDESSATTGRRVEQSLNFQDGFLSECKSVLLQADGSLLFEGRMIFTASTTWTPPAGVTKLRAIIGQGGQGGTAGQNGAEYRDSPYEPKPEAKGKDGTGGLPGKIWHGTININPGTPVDIIIGRGGEARPYGQPPDSGGESSLAGFTSANGRIYENGFTDIASGETYGRTAVEAPKGGTGDGGKPGAGGTNGIRKFNGHKPLYNDNGDIIGYYPSYTRVSERTDGSPGVAGASGYVVVYWDKGVEK